MATAEPGEQLPIQQAGEVWVPDAWSIHLHTNPGWELYFQARGHSTWEIGGEMCRVEEGGAYLIRRDVRHRLCRFAPGGAHFYWVVFPEKSVPTVVRNADCWRQTHTILGEAHDLLHSFQGIIRETSIKEQWQAEACGWHVATLCLAFTRRAENLAAEKPRGLHPAADRALRLLSNRLEHPWRLDELARLSGVSVPHLIAVFREAHGQTPMRTLLRLRVEEAGRRLRQSEKTITEIAFDLGFASSQHLARAYRQQFGESPTATRKRSHFAEPASPIFS